MLNDSNVKLNIYFWHCKILFSAGIDLGKTLSLEYKYLCVFKNKAIQRASHICMFKIKILFKLEFEKLRANVKTLYCY